MPTEEMTYRTDGYAKWLTDNTPVWQWGAFTFETFTLFTPVGTLGEPRDFIAKHYAELFSQGVAM